MNLHVFASKANKPKTVMDLSATSSKVLDSGITEDDLLNKN